MSHVESIYQCSKCLYEYCIQCYSGCPDCGSEHVKIVGDNEIKKMLVKMLRK